MNFDSISSEKLLSGIHLAGAIRSKMKIGHFEAIYPIQIFKLRKDRQMEFTGKRWLQQFLNAPENREKMFFPWLISGKLRSGKSTLSNLLLEALELESDQCPSEGGFEWGFGDDPITNGIICWPMPIKVRMPILGGSFVDVFVILFDTQGLFDAETEFIDCVRLFAISAKISQIFICNTNSIYSDLLNNLGEMLELAEELEKVSNNEENKTNGIKIEKENISKTDFWFLIRDCAGKLGIEGGERVKKQWFGESKCSELKKSIEILNANFRSIHCFLLPLAGEAICDGKLEKKLKKSQMEKATNEEIGIKFGKMIVEFVRQILENEQPVNILGGNCPQFFTGEELFGRMKSCAEIFANPPMDPKFTMAEKFKKLKIDQNEMAALLFAQKKFDDIMEERFSPGNSYANPTKFSEIAENALRISLEAFRSNIDPNSIDFDRFKGCCREIVNNFIHHYDTFASKNDANKSELRFQLEKNKPLFLGIAFVAGGLAGIVTGATFAVLAPSLVHLGTGMSVGFSAMGSASVVLAQNKPMEIKNRIGLAALECPNDEQMGEMSHAERLAAHLIEENILRILYWDGIFPRGDNLRANPAPNANIADHRILAGIAYIFAFNGNAKNIENQNAIPRNNKF